MSSLFSENLKIEDEKINKFIEDIKKEVADKNALIDYVKKNAMYYSIAYLLGIDVEKIQMNYIITTTLCAPCF